MTGGADGRRYGMTRPARAGALGAVLVVALAAMWTGSASSAGKAFPPGCWIGTTKYSGKSSIGPAKGAVSKGTQEIVLWVGPGGLAVGALIVKGNATGTLEIAGSALAAEMKLLGDYDLTGTAAKVTVNGTYRITGTARGTGQLSGTFPINVKTPVKGVLVVKAVTPNRVTGLFRQAPWTATRRSATAAKNPKTCAEAA
jgi:hypothetical protein